MMSVNEIELGILALDIADVKKDIQAAGWVITKDAWFRFHDIDQSSRIGMQERLGLYAGIFRGSNISISQGVFGQPMLVDALAFDIVDEAFERGVDTAEDLGLLASAAYVMRSTPHVHQSLENGVDELFERAEIAEEDGKRDLAKKWMAWACTLINVRRPTGQMAADWMDKVDDLMSRVFTAKILQFRRRS